MLRGCRPDAISRARYPSRPRAGAGNLGRSTGAAATVAAACVRAVSVRFNSKKFSHRQKILNRVDASSVYLTVCWTCGAQANPEWPYYLPSVRQCVAASMWAAFSLFQPSAAFKISSGVSRTVRESVGPMKAMIVPRCRISSRKSVIALSRFTWMICPFASVHLIHVLTVASLRQARPAYSYKLRD